MRILITGMSATGKSSVVAALLAEGYRAVDADYGFCTTAPSGEWVWTRPASGNCSTVTMKCSSSQGLRRTRARSLWRFDHVVLLTAPCEAIAERLATRTNNPFGKTEAQMAQVLADIEEVEPRLRRIANLEIDTRRPLDDVVRTIVDLIRSE